MNKEQLAEHFKVDVYAHDFNGFDDVVGAYNAKDTEEDIIILYASYTYEDYSGSSEVFFYDKRDGKFYEVHGGHCSCYGLEDQWEPEEIGSMDFFIDYLVKTGSTYVLK